MGMPKIELRLQMFRGDWDQIWSQMRLLWIMEGLCRVNQTHLRQFDMFKERGLVERSYPPIYRSGLHYETEKGTEIWPDIPSLLSGVMGEGLYPGAWGDCLPVSTRVLMSDYTTRAIVELAPGDSIMGDGRWTTVVDQVITGKKSILAFELNNGSTFRCSPEHRLFLANGQEVRASSVKPNMHLRTPTEPFPTSTPLHHGRLTDADFAWLLGLYVADGWHEFPRHKRFAISGKDGKPKEEQKKKVKALLEKLDIHTRWNERYIAVNDAELAERMSACGGHAPEKHLPTLAMSREQVVSMLSGLRADASVANSGTITHGTTSPELATQLRILYRMLGQSVHVKRWDKHGGLGSHPIYRVTVRRSDVEVGMNQSSRRNSARVLSVSEDAAELCADITTDTGRFYLPESDLIIHNCEDLACARVAEYRELPWHYEKELVTNDGKRRLVRSDPRFPQDDEAMTAKNADISGPASVKIAELLGTASMGFVPERYTTTTGSDEFPAESATLASPPDGAPKTTYDPTATEHWPGWKRVKGGVKAKPFAKWRKGPNGNYHYHALVLLPDGRLEDPSLVLGMGREKTFAAEGTAEKLRDLSVPVRIQFAKPPSVMVVDPEKPSGYAGGQATDLDAKVKALVDKGVSPEDISATLGDVELGAYLANTIPLGEGEFDVDMVIGWNRLEGRFEPKTEEHELRRLAGYAGH